jgi:hypothetical protein
MASTPSTLRYGNRVSIPVAANTAILKSDLVMVVGGYAFPLADVANARFIGQARTDADNTGGANGDINIEVEMVEKTLGDYVVSMTSPVAADVGKVALAVDSKTVQTAATTKSIPVGVIIEIVAVDRVRVNPAFRA